VRGLVPVMRLAQAGGLVGLLARWVRIGTSVGTHPADKITSIIAGMVTGAHSIDKLDVVRHGGVRAVHAGLVSAGVHLRSRSAVGCGGGGSWWRCLGPSRCCLVPRR
jgi:hypothetical protein